MYNSPSKIATRKKQIEFISGLEGLTLIVPDTELHDIYDIIIPSGIQLHNVKAITNNWDAVKAAKIYGIDAKRDQFKNANYLYPDKYFKIAILDFMMQCTPASATMYSDFIKFKMQEMSFVSITMYTAREAPSTQIMYESLYKKYYPDQEVNKNFWKSQRKRMAELYCKYIIETSGRIAELCMLETVFPQSCLGELQIAGIKIMK